MSFERDLKEVSKVTGTWGRSFIFQRGLKTVYCIPEMMCMDTPDEWTFRVAKGEMKAATALREVYKWNDMKEITLVNHSSLPVYVKVYHVKAKMQLPLTVLPDTNLHPNPYSAYNIAPGSTMVNDPVLNTTTDAAALAARDSITTVGYHSWPVASIYAGLVSKYSSTTAIYQQNDQYWGDAYNGSGNTLNLGEGTGNVNLAASATYTYRGMDYETYLNLNPCYGLSFPTCMSIHESSPFQEIFKLQKVDKFVLGPEAPHVFYLSSKDLRYRKPAALPTMNNDFAVGAIDDPWDDLWLTNMMSKYVIIEVEGSHITSDIATKGPHGEAAATETDGTPATTAKTDIINLDPMLGNVSLHGGWMSLRCNYQYHTGYIDQESSQPALDFTNTYLMNTKGSFFAPFVSSAATNIL